MQIIIEVKSTKAISKTIKPSSKVGSKQFDAFDKHLQRGYLQVADQITGEITNQSIDLDIPSLDSPYPVGRYTLNAASFHIGQFGVLALGKLVLDPILADVASVPQGGKLATAA